MPTLEFLPSVHESETVTCSRCKTCQYPKNGACVRCHSDLGVDYLSFPMSGLREIDSGVLEKQLAGWIGELLRTLRKRYGFCQSQLASMPPELTAATSRKLNPALRFFPLTGFCRSLNPWALQR